MAAMQPYQSVTLGGKTFENKTRVTEYVKQVISTLPLGVVEGEAAAVLRELFELHPNADEKVGAGVDHIELRINQEYKSRGFWIVRVDGTETDISYKNCMDGDKVHRKRFIRACRFAVKEHIEKFKREYFRVALTPTCQLTGVPITPSNSHVDHTPPYTFERIVEAFIVLNELNVDAPGLLVSGVDGLMIPTFVDPVLRDDFVRFHNDLYKPRVISAAANTGLVQNDVRARRAA